MTDSRNGDPTSAGSIIDAGIHHAWLNQAELLEYMPVAWRSYLGVGIPLIPDAPYQNPEGDYLRSAQPPSGGQPGTDPDTLIKYVFQGGVERAVLAFDRAMHIPASANHYLGLQATQAANRWSVDRWLSGQDDRLYGLILVPNQLPAEAAREIRKVGQNARMVGVLMGGNGIGKPFGHPLYDPIYAAASDMGLPVVVYAGGDSSPDTLTDPTPGGLPMTYGEYSALVGCSLLTHLVSFIAQGVFEKFPDLKVLMMGGGATWIPWAFWRADTTWKGLRREIPWVRKLPTEYLQEHMRVGTHPLPRSAGPERLGKLLTAVDGMEELLCYSSSYPHWNTDSPGEAADLIPREWHQKVFHDNAEQLFRWALTTTKRSRRRSGVGLVSGSMKAGTEYTVEYPGWPSEELVASVDYD